MKLTALALASLLLAAPGVAAADDDAYAQGPNGHRFRVMFDPASRVTLGLAGAAERGSRGTPAAAPELDAGIAYRTTAAAGMGRERVTWQVDHRFVTGWVHPFGHPLPSLDGALYGVSILRHDASPSLVLPTSPPVGIRFPFDVGFDGEAGRVTMPSFTGTVPRVQVGVLRAAFTLDPWRSGEIGRSLELGIGARYDIDVEGAPSLASPRMVHRVAPMTAGSVRFRFQSHDGLGVVDARGEVTPHWSSEGAWALSARSSLHLSRVLVAVNDQPIAAVLEGSARYTPASARAEALTDLRVSAGITVNLSLK